MICEICGINSGGRVISGISVCSSCFAQIQALRNDKGSAFIYFTEEMPLQNATEAGRNYVQTLMKEKLESNKNKITESIEEARYQKQIAQQEEKRREQEEKQKEQKENDKRKFAESLNEFYEYDIVTISNENNGHINKKQIIETVNNHAKAGWKLHTIYSNEIGKNSVGYKGAGINSTICEDVLVFERRISDLTYLE